MKRVTRYREYHEGRRSGHDSRIILQARRKRERQARRYGRMCAAGQKHLF